MRRGSMNAQELAVPVEGEHLGLEADVGVGSGLDDAGRAAKCGEFVDGIAVGRGERAVGEPFGSPQGSPKTPPGFGPDES
jgi:hypothetical protein